jgi:hypothetical protein
VNIKLNRNTQAREEKAMQMLHFLSSSPRGWQFVAQDAHTLITSNLAPVTLLRSLSM